MEQLRHLTTVDVIDRVFVFLSLIAVVATIFFLMKVVFDKLNLKERIFLLLGLIATFFLRLKYGLFGPWHAEDHHVEIILNLIKNKEEGSFFFAPHRYMYGISGGLYELIYNNILSFFNTFHVYQVYYISIFLHLIMAVLVFLLALNLFKRKDVAFTSLVVFAFLPILIVISATETKLVVDALTILLFINFAYYIIEKGRTSSFLHVFLLFLLFIANMAGRREYMLFSILLFFLLVTAYYLLQKSDCRILFKSSVSKIFLVSCVAVTSFYLLFFVFLGKGVGVIGEYYLTSRDWVHAFHYVKNFFLFYSGEAETIAAYLKTLYTPWYFFILFLLSPVIFLRERRYYVLLIMASFFLFFAFIGDVDVSNGARKHMPAIILAIPCVAYAGQWFLESLKIKKKMAFTILLLVAAISTVQNYQFLTLPVARKIEQDFLLYHLQNTVPEDSLIITVHEKKYEESNFLARDVCYRFFQHGNEFYTYAIPDGKSIDVMDVYREYDSEITKEYENVFYYKSLYSYHEKEEVEDSYCQEHLSAYEVSRMFEKDHTLQPVDVKVVTNHDYHIRTISRLKRGGSITNDAVGDVEIGLYRVIY